MVSPRGGSSFTTRAKADKLESDHYLVLVLPQARFVLAASLWESVLHLYGMHSLCPAKIRFGLVMWLADVIAHTVVP